MTTAVRKLEKHILLHYLCLHCITMIEILEHCFAVQILLVNRLSQTPWLNSIIVGYSDFEIQTETN